jgi:hypothetical protein
MAIIRNPETFAEHFKIDPTILERFGILNPMLNVDTKLFIDPIIIGTSKLGGFGKRADAALKAYFAEVITLLRASKAKGDVAWRAAQGKLYFREVKGTCLGYGASIRGNGFGQKLTGRLVETAKEIVDLGVDNPDLFKLLPLLEEGVGADLISDMTTRIVLKELSQLTTSICIKLKIPVETFHINGNDFQFPINPTQDQRTPIILVPRDILRDLPVASDWSEVADVVAINAIYRAKVNSLIGDIWRAKTRKQKQEIRKMVLSSKQAIEVLLKALSDIEIEAYDIDRDPRGRIEWHKVHETIGKAFPLSLVLTGPPRKEAAIDLVLKIIDQFKSLIEKKGLWKALWDNTNPRKEKNAQLIFYAVADTYCKMNDLDVTPEADTGAGTVDFKFSSGYNIKILVEAKLSTHPHLVRGYTKQLEAYKVSQDPLCAFYLVIDVGWMGNKDRKLLEAQKEARGKKEPASEIIFINGRRQLSASRR